MIVRIGLGALLVLAAGLKLYGLSASAVPRVGWFAQLWVQLLTVEWELVLGAWLLIGVCTRLSWAVALITFLAFAAVSAYLGWIGVASCGCFGAIKTNPWWAFAVDAAAVGLLAMSRPTVEVRAAPHILRTTGVWVGSVAVLCAILAGGGSLYFGSVEAVLARLRGDTVTITPTYLDFGSGKSGDALEAMVTVENWTGEPVRLVGGTTDCTCAVVDDLPLTVPAGEKTVFRVRLQVTGSSGGQLTRTAMVRTDHPARPTIYFQLGCRIVE